MVVEPWKKTWREAVLPNLKLRHLEPLRDALESNSPELIQGSVAKCLASEAGPGACCAVGYALWKGDKLTRGNAVYFSYCEVIDKSALLDDYRVTGISEFTDWFDYGRREDVFAALLAEVKQNIADLIENGG